MPVLPAAPAAMLPAPPALMLPAASAVAAASAAPPEQGLVRALMQTLTEVGVAPGVAAVAAAAAAAAVAAAAGGGHASSAPAAAEDGDGDGGDGGEDATAAAASAAVGGRCGLVPFDDLEGLEVTYDEIVAILAGEPEVRRLTGSVSNGEPMADSIVIPILVSVYHKIIAVSWRRPRQRNVYLDPRNKRHMARFFRQSGGWWAAPIQEVITVMYDKVRICLGRYREYAGQTKNDDFNVSNVLGLLYTVQVSQKDVLPERGRRAFSILMENCPIPPTGLPNAVPVRPALPMPPVMRAPVSTRVVEPLRVPRANDIHLSASDVMAALREIGDQVAPEEVYWTIYKAVARASAGASAEDIQGVVERIDTKLAEAITLAEEEGASEDDQLSAGALEVAHAAKAAYEAVPESILDYISTMAGLHLDLQAGAAGGENKA